MELTQPIERARQQKIRDLAAAVIVDQRVPVAVKALARVGVLVKRGAVEAAEPVRVVREMPRHPVEQYPDPGIVAGLDKHAEIVRHAIAAGRREQRDRLIAPRAVERVFRDRHELDMGKAHFGDIGDEFGGKLAIAQISAVLGQPAAPRAEMNLIDRDRRLAVVALPASRHPRAVMPHMARRIGDDRRRIRRPLGALGVGVGLQRQQPAVGTEDLVFVKVPRPQTRHKQLPEPGGAAQAASACAGRPRR